VNEAEPNVALGKVRGDAPTKCGCSAATQHILVQKQKQKQKQQKHILLSGEDFFGSPIDFFYPSTCLLPIDLSVTRPDYQNAHLCNCRTLPFDCFVWRLFSDPTTRCIWNKGSPPSFSFTHRSMTTLGPLKQRMTESE
jgi:hypothetical protein